MAATEVGIYVRQAGVWERANAGTPTGFSGPQVRQGGTWQNITVGYAYQALWLVTWANIDGELNLQTVTPFDLDAIDSVGPSYDATAQLTFESDGDFGYRTYNNNAGAPGYTYPTGQWRTYDCGRDYEIKWEEDKDTGPGTFNSGGMTENVWYALSTTRTVSHNDSAFDTGLFSQFSEYDFTIRIRETVSAPAGGNDTASYQTSVELGVGL